MKIDQALPMFLKLNVEVPESGRIKAMVALCFMFNHDFDDAITWYSDACQLMPEHVGSRVNLGWCYLLVNNLQLAEDCFNFALEIDRNFADVHGSLAVISVLKHNWKEVPVITKRALKLNKNCAPAIFAYAQYLEFKGKNKQAGELMNNIMSYSSDVSGISLKEMITVYMSNS